MILTPLNPWEASEDQLRIAREFRERGKHKSEQEKGESGQKSEIARGEGKNTLVSHERKELEGNMRVSDIGKASEIKGALKAKRQLLVLMYKDVYFSTNDINISLPGAVVSLL